jgi:hypothetical protein
MIKANAFMSPLNTQRLKLTNIITTNLKCGKTCNSMVFVTIARNTYSIKEEEEGI